MIAQNLKTALATTFHLYLKTHKFHWNVMGNDFAQHHKFLGEMWEEIFGSVDRIAEAIRFKGQFAPGSFQEFLELSKLRDQPDELIDPMQIISSLINDHNIMILVLTDAYKVAESEGAYDISNMMAERIEAHNKHLWMLNSFLNRQNT